MILQEPYDFKTLKLLNISNTVLNISRYISTDYAYIKDKDTLKIKPFTDSDITLNPVILYGLTDIEKDITPFNHPVINKQEKWIALDLRSVTKPTDNKTSHEVRNEAEYSLLLQRFILSGMWFTNKQSLLYSLKFPHFVYATWISDNLAKRFGLDLSSQLQLRILSLIYYAKLFTNNFTKEDISKLIVRLKNDIIVPTLVDEIYDKIEKLDTIEDFCNCCYAVTGNIRLKNMDSNILMSVVANNWVGLNGKELITLAIDHPPTWIALVYAALQQRSFKKNYLTSIVDKTNKRGIGDEFLTSLIYMTKEYKE